MTADRKDIETIFTSALQRTSAGERTAYLDGACGDDAALRGRVEELLRAHEDADTFLSRPTAGARIVASPSDGGGSAPGADSRGEGPGARIDRYKLLQRIGEGGFGEVYMAEQEEPVRRKVALKIIKLGMDTRQVIGRFEAERQALAMMDHPNIAKVLDAGATAAGRPYFVMELVKGIPFTEYCDKNNLSTRERLALFIPVCNAIQHAHNKGIIHRDIKPNNVLVTLHDGRPVPKVIDFGIAKATHQRLTEKTVFTEFRQFIGTPEYMSPEQAEMSGLDIDTRSDIYSLGVLLYEILTGTTPFDAKTLRKAGYLEITRMIREDDPPAPSTRLSMLGDELSEIAHHRHTEPGMLSRLLRGDLDWIVMTALETDRTRRYETVNALARDIEYYLKDEPVLASPPSTRYKLTKFVRRNRTVVVASSLVLGALVVGLALATVGFVQARRERDAAEEARTQAEESRAEAIRERDRYQSVVESLQTTLAIVDPDRVKGLEPGAQGVLDIARQVVTEASPVPVSFGKYADLDALRASNWTQLGETVLKMNAAILKLYRQVAGGGVPDAALRNDIQRENGKLIKIASGIVGQIPTHGIGGNGEYTHPLILSNLIAAALDVAGQPFTSRQKTEIARAGEAFEREYDRRQATYTGETSVVEKLTDELELKRDCMKRVDDLLTPEQRDVIVVPEIRNRVQFDVLSPSTMVVLFVKPVNFKSRELVRSRFPSNFAKMYELDSSRLEAQTELLDAWYRDVTPVLEEAADEDELLHIDQVITAGRAQANLIKALLRLDDLSEKSREAMRSGPGWAVPRVTYEPIDEVRKSISRLRECCPRDERLADELVALGTLLETGDDRSEAIPVLTEAIEIYRAIRGAGWNSDPLRYQLRSAVQRVVMDPGQSKESYETARRGAEAVLALKPTSDSSLNVLGVAQYRLERHEEALATLARSDELRSGRYDGGDPVDVAFIAMAHLKLEKTAEASAALARLRELMASPRHADSEENRRVVEEAERLFAAMGASPR